MQDDEMAIEVVVPVEEKEVDSIALEKTTGTKLLFRGIWGAFRPVFAVVLSLVPFIFGATFQQKPSKRI